MSPMKGLNQETRICSFQEGNLCRTRGTGSRETCSRKGVLVPLVALFLLALLGGVALTLERMWLAMAQLETQRASDSGALAAARELACDAWLLSEHPTESAIPDARVAAQNAVHSNPIAGMPASIDTLPGGDLSFGILNQSEDGELFFEESETHATTVRLALRREHSNGNPVGRLFSGWSSSPDADVAAFSQASIDNRITGLRPVADSRIPIFPWAIRLNVEEKKTDTPKLQIHPEKPQATDQYQADQYRFDPHRFVVEPGSDGLSEYTLISQIPGQNEDFEKGNLIALDAHFAQGSSDWKQALLNGWDRHDLEEWPDQMVLVRPSLVRTGRCYIDPELLPELLSLRGEVRACLLFDRFEGISGSGYGNVRLTGLISGRIMDARVESGRVIIVFQQAVLATRSAVIGPVAGHPTIFNLSLTH